MPLQEYLPTNRPSQKSSTMATESIVLRSIDDRDQRIDWNLSSSLHRDIPTRAGELTVRHGTFRGGVSEGVEIVRLANSKMHVDVLPTRGMSIWRIHRGSFRYGWQSPVAGPVHPMHVPVSEPSGLGWLSGFDELVVRCGLHSNGAPVHDSRGMLQYPLHGHIANTPADSLSIEYDEASGRIELIGEVIESRLFFKRLRLRSRIRFHADRDDVELLDDVTNDLETEATMQLLYHINIGSPVLGPGAEVITALDEIAPKDERSAAEIEEWSSLGGPTPGYAERVFFGRPRVDEAGNAHAMVVSGDKSHAMAVHFKASTLPYFTLWKNTAGEADGYVTGLEPATGFPNGRPFEQSHDRLISLEAGQTKSFRLRLCPLDSPEAIETAAAQIRVLQNSGERLVTHPQPNPSWSDVGG